MADGDKQKNVEKNVSRQSLSNIFNVGIIFQSIWVRCRSVFPNITNREFMEGQLRIVLYSGIVLWGLYLAWQGIK